MNEKLQEQFARILEEMRTGAPGAMIASGTYLLWLQFRRMSLAFTKDKSGNYVRPFENEAECTLCGLRVGIGLALFGIGFGVFVYHMGRLAGPELTVLSDLRGGK